MAGSTQVIVVMGSKSDLKVMKSASFLLKEWDISVKTEILSAHRTPKLLEKSVRQWESAGAQIIIAGAGGAAHLPGMLAAYSILPVIGVPVLSAAMNGLDALLSIAQMPRGVPVATVAVNNAENAALLAIQILATTNLAGSQKLRLNLKRHKMNLLRKVMGDRRKLAKKGVTRFLKENGK